MLESGFYNIDCIEFMQKIGGDEIDLTLTDIPYEMKNDRMADTLRKDAIREVGKGKADVITFELKDFLNEVYRITKGTIIIFCGINQASEIFCFF